MGETNFLLLAGFVVEQQLIARRYEAELIASNFLDKIGIGEFGRQQRDIALEARPHGLEGSDLKVQQAGPLHQCFSRLEAVTAID